LNRDLEMGNFRTEFLTGDKMPSKIFGSFSDKFRLTIEQEIVKVIESSVGNMSHARAFELFNCKNVEELRNFQSQNKPAAEKRGFEWIIDNNY